MTPQYQYQYYLHKQPIYVHCRLKCLGGVIFGLKPKISKKIIPHMKPKVFFIRKKQYKNFFLKKKNPKWLTQKKVIFQNRQFSIFFSENFMN